MIRYSRPDVSLPEVLRMGKVLLSGTLTQGATVKKFESALMAFTDSRHAFVTNSATSALVLALKAMGVGPGSIVWTSPLSFVASANSALILGARIGFVDVDFSTGNMSADALRRALIAAKKAKSLPKVVMPVHFGGAPADMSQISRLCKEFNVKILEDASHAIGATYRGKPIGACEFSDAAVTSFHAVKMMTTGEGGAVFTNDPEIANAVAVGRSHGIVSDVRTKTGDAASEIWNYEQIELGWNFRLTDFQAQLGLTQLAKLRKKIHRLNKMAQKYRDQLRPELMGLTIEPDGSSSHHLYLVRVPNPILQSSLYSTLRAEGIQSNIHYIPIHLHPYYAGLGFERGQFPASESHFRSSVTIPLHSRLTRLEQNKIIRVINRWAEKNL